MIYIKKILTVAILVLGLGLSLVAQDNRTEETKVADLMVLIPADNLPLKDKLMKDMAGLSEKGWKMICGKIIPPGTGDDTKERFVIESFSRYLSLHGDKKTRERWEAMCLEMVEQNADKDVRMFFIQQLDYVGGDRTIDALAKYLMDKKLSFPAIKAMTGSDGQKAAAAFAENLSRTEGRALIGLVNAIGNINPTQYTSALTGVLSGKSEDTALEKAVFSALAKSESKEATKYLEAAAKKIGYSFESTRVTESLLQHAGMIATKNPEAAVKMASKVLKKSPVEMYRIEARLLLSDCNTGKKSEKILLGGLKEKDPKHRGAVIEEAIEKKVAVQPWLKALKKEKDPEIRRELLYFFQRRNDESVAKDILPFVTDGNPPVRAEALMTYALLKKKQAIPVIIDYMKHFSEDTDTAVAEEVLRFTIGRENAGSLIEAYSTFPTPMKTVALSIFGERLVREADTLVLRATEDPDAMVARTAVRNLRFVVQSKDLSEVLRKYEKCRDPRKRKDYGEALVVAILRSQDPKKEAQNVVEYVKEKRDKSRYIDILAGVEGKEAMKIVEDLYYSGDASVRADALNALIGWQEVSVIYPLFDICSRETLPEDKKRSFRSYLDHVSSSALPAEEKLLLIRKIMPYAPGAEEKRYALEALGNVKIYPTYIYLKRFLNDDSLQHNAANSLAKVILPSMRKSDGLFGKDVKETLERIKDLVNGRDSEYLKVDIDNYINILEDDRPGFTPLFNGKDLSNWKGYVADPIAMAQMSRREVERKQSKADLEMRKHWGVNHNSIVFDGEGHNLVSKKNYGNFELWLDWRILKGGDSGIYLRGTPQVQIWDTSLREVGAGVGSGGLYNNKRHRSTPLKVADNPVSDWNTFHIVMEDSIVTLWLNGELVVDHVPMENYWDCSRPIFPTGPIELQAHGSPLYFRDIYIRELPSGEYRLSPEEEAEGFVPLFNGKNLDGWIGDKQTYFVEEGMIRTAAEKKGNGNGFLYTEKKYKDFDLRFEFKLLPGSNNGLGIRVPDIHDPHPSYSGIELQILDNTAPVYAHLQPYQYHGSLYGVLPAKRGYLKPVREWNEEEVIVKGTHVKVILNGHVILDGDWSDSIKQGTADHRDHPGLKVEKGYIGFLGHSSIVFFRNIRIKELKN